ncbi:ribonuclease H2, subunit B [Ganoderma leucocontextum]|nr:ribonuclease H2, subunit B [Ganoderma leucocontextum]
MACHVGVLPADLLQALSHQLEDSALQGSGSIGSGGGGLCFLRFPHPRTGIPSLFLPYEQPDGVKTSLLEVQAVAPPNPRSWFVHEEVVEDGKLLMMTPIDPVFLLIPLLRVTQPTAGSGNFLPPEDLIEEAANKLVSGNSETPLSPDDVQRLSSLRCIQAAMQHVCEYKKITAEVVVYRYSAERVQTYLRTKVARLSHKDVSELSRTLTRSFAKDGLMDDGKEDMLQAARLRAACDLVSQYLARDVYESLLSSYDFVALDAYMKVLKDEAMALAASKMNAIEAKESGDSKVPKDQGNDKKRKPRASTGVDKLKKANTKGMAKLSTFFQKK